MALRGQDSWAKIERAGRSSRGDQLGGEESGVAETSREVEGGAELRLGRCRMWDFIKRRGGGRTQKALLPNGEVTGQ